MDLGSPNKRRHTCRSTGGQDCGKVGTAFLRVPHLLHRPTTPTPHQYPSRSARHLAAHLPCGSVTLETSNAGGNVGLRREHPNRLINPHHGRGPTDIGLHVPLVISSGSRNKRRIRSQPGQSVRQRQHQDHHPVP
ncbi:hypothetical protein AAur_1161 [Paenarthrobacter aurescens TC1]|uniref:Uncharacterized protein n=1 Tax=Paenarthrobacter aurescens (strain TC1) TaxID=290340 RepID=A1R3Y5_PAEAT|nr:hypothetical protein AAur_1161 [Paenarthrobacter aurescens TC1]